MDNLIKRIAKEKPSFQSKFTLLKSKFFPAKIPFSKKNHFESTFVEFCFDGINFEDENNSIDSLGHGRDSNPDPTALKPSECANLM
jgi:hypothetical protein